MSIGYLLLETGNVFEGKLIGSSHETIGEVVFNTSMTGYQEIMTDPSYAGQIVTFCYPMIGNYGFNLQDNESLKPQLSGMVVGELCENPSHYLASENIDTVLKEAGVSCLSGVDTRALVKVIRKHGTVKGTIVDASVLDSMDEALIVAKQSSFWQERILPAADSLHWVDLVSTNQVQTFGNGDSHVVLMDYGHKKSIVDDLLHMNCRVTLVPYTFTFEQVQALHPDGVVFSNGPGDPMALKAFFEEIKKISMSFPSLGICLGHQLLALAHGASTKKLKFGHRGGNHPVKEVNTGKVMITPQNHSYVVVEESIDPQVFQVSYHNVNDQSVEGLHHQQLPIQTVQFHPEAHPGPIDTAHIFDQFMQQIMQQISPIGDVHYAIT